MSLVHVGARDHCIVQSLSLRNQYKDVMVCLFHYCLLQKTCKHKMLFHIQPYSTVQDNHPSSKEYPCQMKGYVVAVSQTGQIDAKFNVHM